MGSALDVLRAAFVPGAAVLLAAALYCLLLPGRVPCGRKSRRTLGWVLVLLLAVSFLQLAGEFVLARFGLAWRAWVRTLFAGVLGLLACQLLWRGLALVLGAGYMRAVPAEYIPPGAWEELIHLLTH